ncbi:MAG TPA: class I SAM-dependent methyltransferase [Aquella sp.]|nr:class I SAM-dependent methyltransferase [Aquella sp.]
MPDSGFSKYNINKPANYYSTIHNHFDLDTHNIFASSQKIALGQILELIQSNRPFMAGTVVDIGCGTGNMLQMLIKEFTFGHIYGVDLSTEMLEIAKTKIPNLITICDSAVNIRKYFQATTVNLLISHFLFAYIDYKDLLKQFTGITKEGALLSICSTTSNTFAKTKINVLQNLPRTIRLLNFLFKVNAEETMKDYIKFMPQDLSTLQNEMEHNGYKILKSENIHFTITLKTWRDAWSFFHDGSWFVGIMKQYKINKFKMFIIFYFLKIAGLFKNSNGIFKDEMEVVVITGMKI